MRLLSRVNNDHIVVGLSVVIISICSVLLYAEFMRKADAGGAKKIGTVTYKRQVAQRKYASQVLWEDVDRNTPVFDNDSIRTAEESEAVINLGDGTKINIDENSLIVLTSGSDGINIDFSHGSISANRAESIEGEGSRINIQSKGSLVTIEKGDVKLSKTGEKELDVTVTEGKAEIKSGTEEKTIQKNEKVIIQKDAEVKIVKLNLKLDSPPPNGTVVAYEPLTPVNFSWELVEGGSAVYLDVGRDGNFTRGAVTRKTAGRTLVEKLAEGNYYWRIRAVNAANNAIEYSDVRKIIVIRARPVGLIYPPDKDIVKYSTKPPVVNFRWRENAFASEYVVEISRDPAFTAVVRSIATPLLELSVDQLEAGPYYWRVKARNAGLGSFGGTSPVYAFRINRVAETAPPVLISPPNGSRISASMTEKGKDVIFSWSADSQIRRYYFMIAADREFREPLIRSENNGNFYRLARTLQPGTYYWRVAAVADDASKEVFSAPNSILVVSAGSVKPGGPVVTGVRGAGEEMRAAIRFPWTMGDFKGTCRFELSQDRGFLSVIRSAETDGSQVLIDAVPAGAYFWRVRLFDSERNQIAESNALPLYVSVSGALVTGPDQIAPKKTQAEIAAEDAEKSGKEGEALRKEREDEQRKEEELARKRDEENEKLRTEEAARKEKEELAGKQKEELETKRQEALLIKEHEELMRRQQEEQRTLMEREELARKRQEELEAKKRGDAERIQREELAKKEREELALKRQEDLAGKQQDEITKKQKEGMERKVQDELKRIQQEQLARKKQEELARKQQSELDRKKREELALKQREEIERKRQEELAKKRREEEARKEASLRKKAEGITQLREKRPGRRLRWRANIASTVMSRPVFRNNMIIATAKNGILVGLSVNGGQLWRAPLGSAVRSTPAADNTAAYVVTVDSVLYSIDLRSGRINWKKKTDGPLLFGSGPVAEKGMIFVATSYGVVQAFKPDGTQVWRRNLDEGIFSTPAYDGGVLFVGTDRSRVYAVNADDGSIKWRTGTDSRIFTAAPRVYRGMVYVGCYSGTIYALSAGSGWALWKFKADKAMLSAPAFYGDTVYFGSESGVLYALNAGTGLKKWEFNTRGPIHAAPDVSGDSVLVPSGTTVYSVDAPTGDLNWKEGFASGINTPVTVVGNAAYVGLDSGDVVSLSSF